jgi:hypothetical protein
MSKLGSLSHRTAHSQENICTTVKRIYICLEKFVAEIINITKYKNEKIACSWNDCNVSGENVEFRVFHN